jgi:hypothetical protein
MYCQIPKVLCNAATARSVAVVSGHWTNGDGYVDGPRGVNNESNTSARQFIRCRGELAIAVPENHSTRADQFPSVVTATKLGHVRGQIDLDTPGLGADHAF